MKILIVGASGMLGHRVAHAAASRAETWATVRTNAVQAGLARVLSDTTLIPGVDVESPDSLRAAFHQAEPDTVINCAGIVKQLEGTSSRSSLIRVNALFPHELAQLCRGAGARLLQISTDCVFSGATGGYAESDRPDPTDAYGMTKLLGEPAGDRCLVVRTSIVGRELGSTHGLLEWFLAQRGRSVEAWTHAAFSGLTTNALARVLVDLALDQPNLAGLWHVGGPRIAKSALLALVRDAFDVDVVLVERDTVALDRSLDTTRFSAATGWSPPDWYTMIEELASDPIPYELVRRDQGSSTASN